VVDGETGLLVPPGDREGLRAALQRLCEDSEARERMGEAARARARLFAPEAVVPRFESAYELAVQARLKARGGRGR